MTDSSLKILAISLLSISLSAGVALVPVLSDIAAAFPNRKEFVQYLITLPSLFMMFSSLLTNNLSKKISLKLIAVISIFIITFAGISPYWINSFGYLLYTRCMMGIGLGLLNTVVMSLPALYFNDSNTRDSAVGIQSAFVCVGGILFNILSGTVAIYGWKYIFLVQLLNIIPLLASIFLIPDVQNNTTPKLKGQKIFVRSALPILIISFVTVVLTCTYPLNLSLFVKSQGIGDSQFVSLLTVINSVIGFLIGLFFGKIYSKTKGYTLPMGLVIVASALILVTFSPNRTVLLLGSTCFGIGTSFVSPSLYSMLYAKVKPEEIVTSVAILGIASNISQFVSPFIINPIANIFEVNNIEGMRFTVSSAFILLLVIILFLKNESRPKKSAGQTTQ